MVLASGLTALKAHEYFQHNTRRQSGLGARAPAGFFEMSPRPNTRPRTPPRPKPQPRSRRPPPQPGHNLCRAPPRPLRPCPAADTGSNASATHNVSSNSAGVAGASIGARWSESLSACSVKKSAHVSFWDAALSSLSFFCFASFVSIFSCVCAFLSSLLCFLPWFFASSCSLCHQYMPCVNACPSCAYCHHRRLAARAAGILGNARHGRDRIVVAPVAVGSILGVAHGEAKGESQRGCGGNLPTCGDDSNC